MVKISKNFNNIISIVLAIVFIPIILWLLISTIEWIYNFIINYITSSITKNNSFTNESTVFYFLIFLLLASIFTIWKLPKIHIKTLNLDEENDPSKKLERIKDQLKLEDDIRKTIIQIIGGCFVVATVYLSYVSYDQSRKTRNSEQVSKALEALKDNSTGTAGVYLLKKVALNSPEDSGTIIKVLCNLLQEKSRVKKDREISTNTFNVTVSTIVELSSQTSDKIDLK